LSDGRRVDQDLPPTMETGNSVADRRGVPLSRTAGAGLESTIFGVCAS
jgi:hypothetical protein